MTLSTDGRRRNDVKSFVVSKGNTIESKEEYTVRIRPK